MLCESFSEPFFNILGKFKCYSDLHIYRPQRSCGKVMLLHLSVILFTGGCACHAHPNHACPPATHASCHACPPATHAPHHICPPPPHMGLCHACGCTPPTTQATCHARPPGILQHTVNERAVRILLECFKCNCTVLFKGIGYLFMLPNIISDRPPLLKRIVRIV